MHVNLGQGDLKTLIDRIERLERANPLSNSSLGRGQMRFYNGSVLLIENGALRVTGSATISGLLDVSGRAEVSGLLDVTGTANISGILNVSGQTTLSGTTTIAGPTGITGALTVQGLTDVTGELNVTGPTTLDGETTISGNTTVTGDLAVDGPLDVTGDTTLGGTTEITGITTLRSELIVETGKKITLGGLVLENQGTGSAQVQMPGGGVSASTALGMSIVHSSINIGTTNLVFDRSLPTTADPPNLRMDPATGRISRSIWTP